LHISGRWSRTEAAETGGNFQSPVGKLALTEGGDRRLSESSAEFFHALVQRRLRIQHVALDHNWCRWNFDHGAFHVTRRCFGRGTCVSWGQHCGMRELTAVAAKRCDFSIRCSRRDCPVRAGIRSALTGLLSGEDTGRRCDQRDRKKASLYSNPAGTEPDRPRRPLADAGGHMEFSTSSWRASLQVLS